MNSALIQPHPTPANIHAHRPKLSYPKRFVETKNLSQSEWLEVLCQDIGIKDCVYSL
ncbi:hypothetical protein ACTJJG_09075 [Acinetobacter sp. 22512]|uniref:hypothetical protein n=1 Tax=unclassified Acinetobacter TaxID=196816 RepID=UPI003F87FE1E